MQTKSIICSTTIALALHLHKISNKTKASKDLMQIRVGKLQCICMSICFQLNVSLPKLKKFPEKTKTKNPNNFACQFSF